MLTLCGWQIVAILYNISSSKLHFLLELSYTKLVISYYQALTTLFSKLIPIVTISITANTQS